jgi:hypothetical protein
MASQWTMRRAPGSSSADSEELFFWSLSYLLVRCVLRQFDEALIRFDG